LREKKIVSVIEKPVTSFSIGPEGEKVLSSGLPEENLLRLYNSGQRKTVELEETMGNELRYGLAQFFKNGGRVVNGELVLEGDQRYANRFQVQDLRWRWQGAEILENRMLSS